MVGLIPKILLDLVHSVGGATAVTRVKERAGVAPGKSYSISEMCQDEEWRRLLRAAIDILELSPEQAERAFAKHFLEDVKKRFPQWFRMCHSAREFLERQPAIHNSFYSGIVNQELRQNLQDKFKVEKAGDDLIVHYRSPNQLCGVYEALGREILELYDEPGTISHDSCTRRGDEECQFRVCFQKETAGDELRDRNVAAREEHSPAGRGGDR